MELPLSTLNCLVNSSLGAAPAGGGVVYGVRASDGFPRLVAWFAVEKERITGITVFSAANGWSWQAPARRALERDEHAVELWKKEVWPRVKAPRRRSAPGSYSKTRPGLR
ncbi:winged helix-turn-helix domain-containing protein [Streptomyces sp. NBC_01643]|uniref:winged helix-turn-helix domain-containing protein n=1 Tax=Streptomyces sp. NBC_01643 TaxID=2975906 RepID=UPI00386C4092